MERNEEIYQQIVALAEQGKSVIILSSEAPEVMRICHTINVMYQGEITARFNGEEATEEEIMRYATGSKGRPKKLANTNVKEYNPQFQMQKVDLHGYGPNTASSSHLLLFLLRIYYESKIFRY